MPDFTFENAAIAPVAGIDEAGRGPWAGPVVAAAVIRFVLRCPLALVAKQRLQTYGWARLDLALSTSSEHS